MTILRLLLAILILLWVRLSNFPCIGSLHPEALWMRIAFLICTLRLGQSPRGCSRGSSVLPQIFLVCIQLRTIDKTGWVGAGSPCEWSSQRFQTVTLTFKSVLTFQLHFLTCFSVDHFLPCSARGRWARGASLSPEGLVTLWNVTHLLTLKTQPRNRLKEAWHCSLLASYCKGRTDVLL